MYTYTIDIVLLLRVVVYIIMVWWRREEGDDDVVCCVCGWYEVEREEEVWKEREEAKNKNHSSPE